jgi:methionyl-tRNA formyltransferase
MFMGSKTLGLHTLEALLRVVRPEFVSVVTIDDTGDSRSAFPAIRDFCDIKGIPLWLVREQEDLEEAIGYFSPDAVFVVGWYRIIPQRILKQVPKGFVGFHASLLPQLRGNAPLVWSVLLGYRKTGVTMFYFDAGMDTGDIIAQKQFLITEDDTIADLLGKADAACSELVELHAVSVLNDNAPRQPQDDNLASYGSLRRPSDGMIDWSWSANKIYNFTRAQTKPYPGAYTYLPDGRSATIWRVVQFPYPFYGIPGLVCQTHQGGVVISAGENAVVVLECEVDGREVTPDKLLKWGMRLG